MSPKATKTVIKLRILSIFCVVFPTAFGLMLSAISYQFIESSWFSVASVLAGLAISFGIGFLVIWIWDEHEADIERWAENEAKDNPDNNS